MYNVVNCYKEGIGINKDIEEMIQWTLRLAKLENPENLNKSGYVSSARLILAYMFKEGTVVEKNIYKSYQWYLIFNESKKDFSFAEQNQVVDEFRELEDKLTIDQKENAKSEAEKIIGRQLKNISNLRSATSM